MTAMPSMVAVSNTADAAEPVRIVAAAATTLRRTLLTARIP
jgi:hypothetical protein